MNGALNLNLYQVLSAYIFIVILLVIVKARRINREKEILISTIRMTLQLILAGYILTFLFKNPNPFLIILVMAAMEAFSIHNVYKRAKIRLSKKIKNIVVISLLFGTISTLLYFLFVVIRIHPWYNPRYFIPIAGMIIGNSMTGVSLGVSKLVDGMNSNKNFVETALMLGATPKTATKSIVDKTFDSAILPTINSMVGMGIVFLPGMMTGQILSGTSPLTAIEYQIAIMLGILGSVSITVIIFVNLGYKSFFNSEDQFIL